MGLCLKSQGSWLDDSEPLSKYRGLLVLKLVDFERKPAQFRIKSRTLMEPVRQRSGIAVKPRSFLLEDDDVLLQMSPQELVSIVKQERRVKEKLEMDLQRKEAYIKLQGKKIGELQSKLSGFGSHASELPEFESQEAYVAAINLLEDIDTIFGK